MATECDTTGVIVKTSKDTCVVSVTIDGTPKLFLFSKTILHSFGERCDGDMTNLLDNDMEVEVCYTIRTGTTPTILAVWLGEKPQLVDSQSLKPIYDRKGTLNHIRLNDYVADSVEGKILISKGVVFQNGQRVTALSEDEEISFDAVPFQDTHVCGAMYKATCAWIGLKPRIVDRFHLQEEETEVEFDDVVTGTVGVIPNDIVAFVDVEINAVLTKVLLFRGSFKSQCDRISDVVNIGDRLCMRLGYVYVFPGRRQWFARVASKTSDEVIDLLEACEPQDVETGVDTQSAESAPETCDIRPFETNTDSSENASSVKPTAQFNNYSKILYSDPPLAGVISAHSSFGCIKYNHLKILLQCSNFYADGKQADYKYFDSFKNSGKNVVNFEAVLLIRDVEEYSLFSHEATCAWVGKKPTLADLAASLPPPNFELLEEKNQVFYGIVSKLCFPSVALVRIPALSTTVSVHLNNFVTEPFYSARGICGRTLIGSFVKLDDCVQFKVEKRPQCPKLLCSSDARLETSREIVDLVRAGLLSRKLIPNVNGQKPQIGQPVCQSVPCKAKDSSSSPEQGVCIASPFKNGPLSQNRAFLINCLGTIRSCSDAITKNSITLEHIFGSSRLNKNNICVEENKVFGSKNLASFDGRQVRFDAQVDMSPKSNSNFVVQRMWNTGDKRPPTEIFLYSELKLLEKVSTRCCPGTIRSMPFHDAAVATVQNVPVLVPFDSLVTLKEVNRGCSSIDTILYVGDIVGLKFEERDFPGEMEGCYYRAVSCWFLSKGGGKIKFDDQIRTCVPRVNSWFNKWGYGQFSCTGSVLSHESKHFVRYSSKRLGLTMNLDIFEKGKVYINEMLVEDKLKVKHGKPITYHVAHENLDKLSNDKSREMFNPKGMFVACSWVGKEPCPKHVLKDVLAAPEGCICSNWCYEVVVDSFPLPTHAICLLGFFPVLVPLPRVTQTCSEKENLVSVRNVNLKRGDRIVVRILEEKIGDTTILVSNDSSLKKVSECDYTDVMKNVAGKVEKIPNPTGLIKAYNSGIMVSFELCHVRRMKKSPGSDKKWFEGLNIYCGKNVYFSAAQVNAKTAPYRAFEVYFD